MVAHFLNVLFRFGKKGEWRVLQLRLKKEKKVEMACLVLVLFTATSSPKMNSLQWILISTLLGIFSGNYFTPYNRNLMLKVLVIFYDIFLNQLSLMIYSMSVKNHSQNRMLGWRKVVDGKVLSIIFFCIM